MDWTVGEAFPTDSHELALIGAATFLETFAAILDGAAIVEHCRREHVASAYERFLSDGASAWLARVEPGGAPVGFALLAATDLPGSARDGSDIELKRIYLLSRFHGSGCGKALMDTAVERAEARGARRLLLGVYAGNTRARAFYRRQGFEQIADRRFRVGDREYDDVVLARTLPSAEETDPQK